MARQLALHPEVRRWLDEIRELDRLTVTLIAHALRYVIERSGPAERPPLVVRLKGSRVRQLKELRPASGGRIEARILFTVDPGHGLLLLAAGDRVANWNRWHREAVPLAEARCADLDGGGWVGYERAEDLAAELGATDDELARAVDITDSYVWAWHLSQVRRDQDRTQGEIAAAMGVGPARVGEVEHGDLDRVTLAALRAYVRALGGTVRVVADFGDHRYYLT